MAHGLRNKKKRGTNINLLRGCPRDIPFVLKKCVPFFLLLRRTSSQKSTHPRTNDDVLVAVSVKGKRWILSSGVRRQQWTLSGTQAPCGTSQWKVEGKGLELPS
eukprot:1341717-Amphidinium_carterae.1